MAFTHFYIQGGASDLNAGSTTDAAAAFTYAGGTFVRATGVFTVASGNPLSDGVAVGTYASVYTTAGAVAATFVAQIIARDATTITVDITTLKWGVATSVSETAAATTLKVSGAWTSEVVLAATGLGTFTVPTSTKINFKGNLTTAATRTISMAGATTAPIWFSGYTTTPGDLDADTTNSLAKPIWTLGATFQLVCSGAHQIWSSLSVVGNRSGFAWRVTGAPRLVRCRCENVSANAAASAFTTDTTNGTTLLYSWFKCPATATSNGVVTIAASFTGVGVIVVGGGLCGFEGSSSTQVLCDGCVALNNVIGFSFTTGSARVVHSTVYNASSDGIRWSGTPAVPSAVFGCLFNICGSYGINNSSGTNTNVITRSCNDFYSCTSGSENGFGDSPAFFGQTDASSVVTSSTDMTPVRSGNARENGFPGVFENQSYRSFADIGAVQHPDTPFFVVYD